MATWLIVEDDEGMLEMLMWMFQAMGAESKTFPNGEALVEWADALEEDNDLPELALVDLMLGGEVSGIDAAAHLRRHPLLGDMAIVLMTARSLNANEEVHILAMTGADKLLQKPLPRKDEFEAILKSVVEGQ